jgi:hypothetical protein
MKEQNSNQKTNKTPVVALDRVGASKHPCAWNEFVLLEA